MFLPHHHTPTNHYKEESLFPILTSDELLKGADQSKLISKIRQLLPIPDDTYQPFYGELIEAFTEFVQSLPLLQGGPIGEMLNLGLERACIALEILKELNLLTSDDVLVYALFSAALLQDLGWVTYRRSIVITNQQGFFIKEWLPYSGSMVDQGEYFRIRYLYDSPDGLDKLLNPIFLSHIMPEKGFALLASDRHLLASWLAWCEGDEDGSGGFGLRLNLVQERLKALMEKRMNPLCTLVNLYSPPELELAESFWKWLKERLQQNKIKINDRTDGVFRVKDGDKDGLVITDKVFKDFASRHAKRPKASDVKKRFLALGITLGDSQEFVAQPQEAKQPAQPITSSKYRAGLFKPDPKKTPAHTPQYQKGLDPTVSKYDQYVVGCVIPTNSVPVNAKALPPASNFKSVVKTNTMNIILGNTSSAHTISTGTGFNPNFVPKE